MWHNQYSGDPLKQSAANTCKSSGKQRGTGVPVATPIPASFLVTVAAHYAVRFDLHSD